MKVLRLLVALLLGAISLAGWAQTVGNDTVPYKIGHYDIKKQEKVSVVAARLGVDPQIIVKLNKLRNTQQDLVVGQRVKIPIYPKGYKYTPETVVVHKAPQLDSAAIKLLYGEEAKTTPPVVLPPLTKDEAQSRLEMVDVMLEMNEAMLQGVKASIDTLNVPESNAPVDDKNIQVLLQRMKRARDKVLLMPYLEHIQDSLSEEMVLLTNEKTILNKILQPTVPEIAHNDTVLAVIDTAAMQARMEPVKAEEAREDSEEAVLMKDDDVVKDDNKKMEVRRNDFKKKKFKDYYPLDTIIIYDVGPTASARNYAKNEELIKSKQKSKWDTARAIDPAIDSATLVRLQKPIQMPADSGTAMKIKIPNTLDSVYIKPIKVTKKVEPKDTVPEPALAKNDVKDTAQKVNAIVDTSAVAKVDTAQAPAVVEKVQKPAMVDTTPVAIVAPKDTVAEKPVVKKPAQTSVGDMAIAAADSVKHIKAEFFYKRAQKALSEKNFRNAEQYLKKAVDLYPRHFEAWFALAEMDDLFGSQGQALKEYKICESIDSTQSKLYYNMGNIYQKMKRKTDAYKAFDRAIELNPEFVLALMARANILSDWKNYDAALYDYDKVIELNRTYHYAYKARGQVKLLNKDFKGAVDDFTRFLIFEETDPSAYYYRGLAKIGTNDLLEGCLDLSKAADMGYVAAQKIIKKTCQ